MFGEISQVNGSLQRILIVEDNDDLRNYLIDMFKTGYNVQSCPNGKEALVIVREFDPDLVISDIMMPEMGGDELCSVIKGDLEISHIPVILLTALGDEKNMLEGLQQSKTYLQIVLCSVRFITALKIENRLFQSIAPIPWIGNS